jgi:hypothetical protein
MKIYIKHTTLMIAALACIIYLAGCSKSTTSPPASIVGTWGLNSQEIKVQVNGVTKYDSTTITPLGSGAFTFAPNGYYAEYYGGGILGGAYTYTGNTLSIFDTVNGNNKWIPLTVTSLTAGALSFKEKLDSIQSGGLDTVSYIVFNLTR